MEEGIGNVSDRQIWIIFQGQFPSGQEEDTALFSVYWAQAQHCSSISIHSLPSLLPLWIPLPLKRLHMGDSTPCTETHFTGDHSKSHDKTDTNNYVFLQKTISTKWTQVTANSLKNNECITNETLTCWSSTGAIELNLRNTYLQRYTQYWTRVSMHVYVHAVDRADKPNSSHCMTCFQLFYKCNKPVIHTKDFRDGCLPLAGFGVQDLVETVWGIFGCFVLFFALLFSCGFLFWFCLFVFKKEHME